MSDHLRESRLIRMCILIYEKGRTLGSQMSKIQHLKTDWDKYTIKTYMLSQLVDLARRCGRLL